MSDANGGVSRSARWFGSSVRLDRVLPELSLARSRSQAAEMIATGLVAVDGVVATKAGVKVATGSSVAVARLDHYVSRAAHKLIAGLDAWKVPVRDRLALDLGASTGGFTQVLLERGASAVMAIDVGHSQLVESLRADPRVHVVEECNARDLTPEVLAERTGVQSAPDLVVADLSFISLTLVLPAIARVAAPGAELVLLIKPQFEVGRQGIREGIVTDAGLAAAAVLGVLRAAASAGYRTDGVIRSPIAGSSGNQEYVGHFVAGGTTDPGEWEARIRELTVQAARDEKASAHARPNSTGESDDRAQR